MSVSRREQRRQRLAAEAEYRTPAWSVMARGVATFFGIFLLYDVFVSLGAGFPWWFESRALPDRVLRGAFTFYAVGLMYYGLSGREPRPLRWVTRLLTCLLLMLILTAIFDWYDARRAGLVESPVQVPFLLQIAGILTVILAGVFQPIPPSEAEQTRGLLWGVLAFDICIVLVPLTHIYCAGQSSDPRRSRTIVIFAETPPDRATTQSLTQKLEGFLGEDGQQHALISGPPDSVRDWREWLHEQPAGEFIQVQTTDSPQHSQEFLEHLARARPGETLVVAAPEWLAAARIRLARSGVPMSQLALHNRPLVLFDAV
jgi:hypothetical protein